MRKYTIIFFIIMMGLATTLIMTSCGNVVLDAPENLCAVAGTREVTVTWSEVDGADSYNLYWNNSGGVNTSDNKIAGITTSAFIHTELSLFKTYYYVMTAVNSDGESLLSNEVSALPALIPIELQKRIASDAETGDNFGYTVSISGDYAIVGAYYEYGDGGGTERGAAYIFYRNEGGENNWGEVTKLTASDAADYDWFGYSVSISGDYAIVGACCEDGYRGAAYIFYRNEGGENNWGEVTKLTASDKEINDWFGYSLSISGDYAIVGACFEDGSRGAAYIFYRNEGGENSWGEVTKLTASDKMANDRFGGSVFISDDYAILGASGKDSSRGAAYIFYRNQGGADLWGQVKKLTASDAQDSDLFGYSVSISGDYAIVGASYEDGDVGETDRGAAYIFRNQGVPDTWVEVTKLTASDAQDSDFFSYSVSISGDYAIVGAYKEDGLGTDRGAAYIFYRNQGGADLWGEVTKLNASDAQDSDLFGCSVSISGDYAIVGAYYEDEGASAAGAFYIY